MSLSQDLFEQAGLLANLDPKRPKQANLRRAVSAAYYSLFHRLLDEIDQQFAPGLRRFIEHAQMSRASRAVVDLYGRQQTPNSSTKGIPAPLRGLLISSGLNDVAGSFVELQRLRHDADYDVGQSYTKRDTLANIAMCDRAFAAWEDCRKAAEARAYLTMMVVDYEKLKDR